MIKRVTFYHTNCKLVDIKYCTCTVPIHTTFSLDFKVICQVKCAYYIISTILYNCSKLTFYLVPHPSQPDVGEY